jgi:Na+:H+ antiporter, NhaA family
MTSDKPGFMAKIFDSLNPRRIVDAGLEFLRLEAAGGLILIFVSGLALLVANSSFFPVYDYLLHHVQLRIGFSDGDSANFYIEKNVLHWINDGLMVLFFMLIALEIKREMLVGSLNTGKKAMLPVLTGLGGMVVPAILYWCINKDTPETIVGWAIPCATDIAFALAIIALLGNRVPPSIKVLLLAAAIIDDLGSIVVIALFYSQGLEMNALLFAMLPIFALYLLNSFGVYRIAPYMLFGTMLWLAVLESGVHATLAGVITALFIPLRIEDERRSPCQRLEGDLHPWVVYIILPIFGFANAGVPFTGLSLNSLMEPVTLGIIVGLIAGKQLGIFGTVFLCVKSGLCPKPEGASWVQIYGMSILCGIGFTMSLFIGGLAFSSLEMQAEVRLGVLVGSFISAGLAYMLLRATSNHKAV